MRWTQPNTAPFASLFLLLAAIVIGVSEVPVGEAVQIAAPYCDPRWISDGRNVVAYVSADGLVQLNSETFRFDDLRRQLHQIYDIRAERVLFVTAAPGAHFQTVADVIDVAKEQIEVVAILTPTVQRSPCWQIWWPTKLEWASTGRTPEPAAVRDARIVPKPRLNEISLWPW